MNVNLELFNDLDSFVNELSAREKVNILETEMKKQPQVELEIKHYFSYGVYARELFIPKGIMLTGKIHKYPQLNILIKGEMSVLVDEIIKRVKAPFIVESKAGTKRIAIAHEDSIWITILGTNLKNVEEIENEFIANTEQEYMEFFRQYRLEV